MKKWLFPVVALATLFIGCDDISEDSAAHNQGTSCLSCHASSDLSEGNIFTSGATRNMHGVTIKWIPLNT